MTSPAGPTVRDALERWAGHRLLPESEVPCAAPFVTLEFGAYGMVQACCANALYPVGDVRRQSIREIWEGFRIGALRDAFRRGDLGPGCGVCRFRLLHTPGELPRNYYDHFGFAGGETPEWPVALSFSLHNTCNLACVMCGGDESSKIRSTRDHLPPLPHVYGDEFFEQLQPFLEHCEYADFVGGEPFLVREHERIWDQLVANGRDVRCSVATNGTVWNDRVEHWLDALDFQVTVSVDGITPETFERIRVGASYDEVYRNIERFRSYTADRGRPFMICWSLVRDNWHELPDMLRWAEERGIPMKIQTVMEVEFGVQAAPTDELRAIVDRYREEDRRLSDELRINRDVWQREVQRLEAELTDRSSSTSSVRQMRGPDPTNAAHIEAVVRRGPAAEVPATDERLVELLGPWVPSATQMVPLVELPDGTLDGVDQLQRAVAGRIDAPLVADRGLSGLLTSLAQPFGGGVVLAEEFVGKDVVEHLVFLGRQFRDKTGMVLRMVSWLDGEGRPELRLVLSDVLAEGGAASVAGPSEVPVRLTVRPSA